MRHLAVKWRPGLPVISRPGPCRKPGSHPQSGSKLAVATVSALPMPDSSLSRVAAVSVFSDRGPLRQEKTAVKLGSQLCAVATNSPWNCWLFGPCSIALCRKLSWNTPLRIGSTRRWVGLGDDQHPGLFGLGGLLTGADVFGAVAPQCECHQPAVCAVRLTHGAYAPSMRSPR